MTKASSCLLDFDLRTPVPLDFEACLPLSIKYTKTTAGEDLKLVGREKVFSL